MKQSMNDQPKRVNPESAPTDGIDLLMAYQTLINAYVRVKTEQVQDQCENIVQNAQEKEIKDGSQSVQSPPASRDSILRQ